MKNEFALAFNEVLEEKQLPKEIILSAIESAMVSAYRRAVNASNAQHVEAKVDPETGQVLVYAEKEVVEDIQDERTEVLLEVARAIYPEVNLGDMAIVETTPKDFGRVAAQTARQVIQQRIREAERQVQTDYYAKQVGEIISGVVQAVSMTQGVTVGLDMKAEGIMPPNQKIPGERFRVHDRVRAIVLEVKDSPRGPQIILSRSHRNFLRRLLENEVPEIYHGVVEIRAISREPGQRAKVAVSAAQPNVDPVGACVGIRGVRIQAIVKELHDEKIDIIEWNPDTVMYISKAISPARVAGVYLNEADKTATVVVQEDQLSLAIGRDGQNARLAAKLTGWRIDIKSLVEATADSLAKLQSDTTLEAVAEKEKDTIPAMEAILVKKDEGRPLTPEEYTSMHQFVERVERRSMEKIAAEVAAEEERLSTARAEIPAIAFETDGETLGLPEHVYNILTEAELRTVGDLMLTMKLDPDSVLGLAGIGPKAMQAIAAALAAVSFPEPEPEPEPVAEAAAVETAEAPAAVTAEAPPEATAEITPETAIEAPVEVPAEAAPAVAAEELDDKATAVEQLEEKEEEFEKLFTMETVTQVAPASEEEESDDKKKDKKKKKKDRQLEFDEALGEVVARKKHKRGEEGWEEEW
ncbi:MAG: transcription termination/antitermination protein NusA [Anaerolineales bacterium]|nr:transcription termination/antitermination protein NusA [Anaerolineales bacterium]